ncbi:unnamed protein product [Pieris macdunnoughi]|uniref:Uncharacterized protein n=1 Tax=Pieris macdunnoughi TaxID=345717 RepID=A0A821VGI9_9NEOP|nr:unnamed protein product [Pieris macdunnoughi]
MITLSIFTCIFLNWLTPGLTKSEIESESFEWDRNDRSFDCIVGIEVHKKRVGQGVIVNLRTIVTSANPLNAYINNKNPVKVFSVEKKTFNNSVDYPIDSIKGNQVKRESVWIQIGEDRTNSPIHDIVLIILSNNVSEAHKIATFPFSDELFEAPLPDSGWIVSGFGYADIQHIKNHRILEISILPGKLLDCDEWFPRDWGHFICIDNEENLPGVPSGGPLFHIDHGKTLFGVGCFSLRKGNESILVFTNLKLYRFGLRGYFFNPTEGPKKKEETTTMPNNKLNITKGDIVL